MMISRLVIASCLTLGAALGVIAFTMGLGVLPLDDAYIYMQYADSAVAGSPFRYFPGEPLSSGVTSPGWFGVHALGAALLPADSRAAAILVVHALLAALAFLLMARNAKRLGVPPAITWVPGALLLLMPLWVLGAINGMESALFGVALLLAARTWYGASLGWLALLPLVRPEGVLVVIIVLGKRWLEANDRQAFLGRALPIILVGVLGMAWPWLLADRSSAGWFAKALVLEPHPEVLAFYTERLPYFAGRALLFGLSGAHSQPPLDLTAIWWTPAAVPSWLWLAYLGGGALLAVVRRRGRALVLLWVAATLPCIVTAAWDAQYYRYLIGGLPLLVTAATAGWFGSPGIHKRGLHRLNLSRRWPRFDRLAARRVLVGGALLAVTVAGAVFEPPGLIRHLRLRIRRPAEYMRASQMHMGRRIRDTLPPEARIAVHDAGALAWVGHRRITDLVGLTTPEFRGAYRHGSGALWEALAALPGDRRPTHAAVVPAWRPYLYRTLWFDSNLTAGGGPRRSPQSREFELWTVAWPDTGISRRFQDVPVSRALNPGSPWLVIDEIDVARLDSEVDHTWTQDLTPWLGGTDELTLVRDLGFTDTRLPPTIHAIEGGRRIPSGAATFRLEARSDRPTRVVVRVTSTGGGKAELGLGAWSAPLEIPTTEARFHEAVVELPPDLLNDALARGPGETTGSLLFRIEGKGLAVYHVWLMQRAGQKRPGSARLERPDARSVPPGQSR